MRQKLMLLFFSALTLLLGCKKKPPYSYWTVNGDSFSSNDVDATIGKAVAIFGSNGISNSFSISYYGGYFPVNDTLLINPGNGPDLSGIHISFYYNTKFLIISPNTKSYLEASEQKNKAIYHLHPTWFVNYDNANDSVLISGTFNEP